MYIIEIPFGTPAYDEAVQLRDEVLRQPLGLVFFKEDLEKEFDQIHLGCYTDSARLVGCLTLQKLEDNSMKMRQVAVDPSFQKKGVGKLLVAASEDVVKQADCKKMVLNARDVAIPFYQKLDYKKVGRPFTEVNIKHYKMTKDL